MRLCNHLRQFRMEQGLTLEIELDGMGIGRCLPQRAQPYLAGHIGLLGAPRHACTYGTLRAMELAYGGGFDTDKERHMRNMHQAAAAQCIARIATQRIARPGQYIAASAQPIAILLTRRA